MRETEQYEAVQRGQRLAEELRRAATMQQNLLPPEPVREGRVEAAGGTSPPSTWEATTSTSSPPRTAASSWGSGTWPARGMAAAMLMMNLQATVRAQVETGRPLADVMARLNRSIHQNVQGEAVRHALPRASTPRAAP